MLDWTRISELQNDLGEDGFAEMAVMFLDEIEQALHGLPGARADPVRLAETLHMIKGCALNVGLGAVASHAAQLEHQTPSATGLDQDFQALQQKFFASRREFLSHFDPGMVA